PTRSSANGKSRFCWTCTARSGARTTTPSPTARSERMPAETRTTSEERNDAREQASQAVESVVQHARPPLLAALGASDLAAQTVRDTFSKVRAQLNERTETARQDLPSDLTELREKLDPAELRRLVDAYTE